MSQIQDAKRVVIKIGTSTLAYATGRINIRRFELLCKVLADLKNSGKEIILVSSGAIGVGVSKLGLPERPRDVPGKQAAAAVGQCELMYLYDLLTRDAFEDPRRRQNMKNTFDRLLSLGTIPIVNENDTVATEELEFGDNDTLSAQVAELTEADALVILSDIDGLYDSDPNKNPDAKLIAQVDRIDEHIESIAGGSVSGLGTGGMTTKIHAAKITSAAGIIMAIINGSDPKLLYDLFDGMSVGTLFLANK